MVAEFYEVDPSLESQWRAIVLFGRNVASYKFALGKSLIELAREPGELVKLEELARPFSRHVCEHLRLSDRQSTPPGSRLLDACRKFNRSEISETALLDTTTKLGVHPGEA